MLSSISSSRMMELKQEDSRLLFSVSQRWIDPVSYRTGFRLNPRSSRRMLGSLLLSPTPFPSPNPLPYVVPLDSCCFGLLLSLGRGGLAVGAMRESERGGSWSSPRTILEKSTCESSRLKMGLRSLSRDLVRETFSVFWWWYFRICTCASSLSIRQSSSAGREGGTRWCCSAMHRTSLRRSVMLRSMDLILASISSLMSSKTSSISFWTISRMNSSCLNKADPPVEPVLENLPDINLNTQKEEHYMMMGDQSIGMMRIRVLQADGEQGYV